MARAHPSSGASAAPDFLEWSTVADAATDDGAVWRFGNTPPVPDDDQMVMTDRRTRTETSRKGLRSSTTSHGLVVTFTSDAL